MTPGPDDRPDVGGEPPCALPARDRDAHKGDFGRVLLIGGSRGMAGSIAIATRAALHTGSGLVTAAVPDRCLETVAAAHPAAMTIPLADDSNGRFSLDAVADLSTHLSDRYDAIGCGPGMTTAAGSHRIVDALLRRPALPRVMDADAINVLSEMRWGFADADDRFPPSQPDHATFVLTPHPGELARLTGVPPHRRDDQIDAAADLARRRGVVVVVKGGPSVVVNGHQRYVNTTGNPGMATGGSGDCLTGILTSLLGHGLSAWDAARLGVWLHGRAGDLAALRWGQAGMTAIEIVAELPLALK